PELANCEGFIIGVEPGAANPRSQFNVFVDQVGYALAWEGNRYRASGNQFLQSLVEVRQYADPQRPAILYGTDGDGVNDADEGNLWVNTGQYSHLYTGNGN